jgi:imidazole glycerol-phosphate synthase subunit HisH
VIAIVDYGLGNVQAIANTYKRLNIAVTIARDAASLQGARKVVLPGVGAFDWAMTRLNNSGMREALDAVVRTEQCDVIGICVGMQILAERSEEGQLPGLGWIRGKVRLFDDNRFSGRTHLPHMGWNDVEPRTGEKYFLHSYHFVPASEDDVLAMSNYGGPFVCAVRHRNVFGAQFHPEKSHQWGIQFLKNFAEL